MTSSLVPQVEAGGRMAQELKNSRKPYEGSKLPELLDSDVISVLDTMVSMGNGFC